MFVPNLLDQFLLAEIRRKRVARRLPFEVFFDFGGDFDFFEAFGVLVRFLLLDNDKRAFTGTFARRVGFIETLVRVTRVLFLSGRIHGSIHVALYGIYFIER